MIAKSHHWQKTALAVATLALLSLPAHQALALSLGRLTVLSSLGEPLRAEIDVPDINAEEAASLKTSIASPEAFVAAGLEYNAIMSSLQATLSRRADGRAFIRLSGDRPVNDPFVDMILETTWSSGRVVRDYTMLFDPPALKQVAPANTLAQTSPMAPSVTTDPARAVQQPSKTPLAATKLAPTPSTQPVNVPGKTLEPIAADSAKQVVIQPGDTASKIANQTKAAGVSLDQMLVALLRANPDAFVNSNLNRIRAGAVMNVPSAGQAQSVPADEATQIVVAQSKDFNTFRRNLATNAPVAAVATASRKASGSIEAKVEDRKPTAATPDKLTLSKGEIKAKENAEQLLKERAEKEAKARADELAKNISDLKKLTASSPAVAAPVSTAAKAPIVPVAPMAPVAPPPAVFVASAPAPSASSAPAKEPTTPASAAPAPVASGPASAPRPMPAPAPAPVEQPAPSLMDELFADPLIPAAVGGLIALLGGFAFWRVRQRKKDAAQVDSSFLESRLQPDSFFGASGGQQIDTSAEGQPVGSSMMYSPSQLDSADDVDPVAEADVYLAYGRDIQAEEILKEAIKTTPGRLAIHTKLLEIYAKRRDAVNFEASAKQALKLTGPDSSEWAVVCDMGLGFDPSNPLYQPGGAVDPANATIAMSAVSATSSFGSTMPVSAHAALPEIKPGVDLDLDLDFSLDDEPASAFTDITGGSATPVLAPEPAPTPIAPPPVDDNSMDFDLPLVQEAPAASTPPAMEPLPDSGDISLSMDGLSMSMDDLPSDLSFDATSAISVDLPPQPLPVSDNNLMEFDMSSLSLDLPSAAPATPTEAPWTEGEDPLETKLALAEEFVSIGDEDGARALIEEVVAESTGEMRAKAQRALANLS